MSKLNRIVLWLLAVLFIAGLALYAMWFLNNYERQTELRRVEVSPEALRNPFLAAEQYLQSLGYQAESIRGRDLVSMLPPAGDALVLRQLQPGLTQQQLFILNDWIEAGGVLIVAPRFFSDSDNSENLFFNDLGVALYEKTAAACEGPQCPDAGLHNDEQTKQQAEESSDPALASGYYRSTSLRLSEMTEPVTVTFRNDRYLMDHDQWAVERGGDEPHWHYLRYETGSGAVVVLSDLDLFSNDRIGKQDNAWLLGQAVAGSRKVWLQYSVAMLPLPELLWQRMPFLVTTVALLLLLMVWRLFHYTGPRLQLQDNQRRNLLEHIDATSAYAWRLDRGRSMFETNRQALEQAWRKRHPALNGMAQSERSQWIAEKTGMSGLAVERSLYHRIDRDQDFIKATLVLQQLASGLKQRGLG